MTNEEMKVLKFKTMIDGLYNKMQEGEADSLEQRLFRIYTNERGIAGVGVLLENKDEDPYLNIVLRQSATVNCVYRNKWDAGIENLIISSKNCQKCSKGTTSCSMPLRTIFFSLMALAIDEKLYDEKLETVSDAAYMMGFNEAMIEDWITVVKKFLMAEKIDSQQLKTEEAKKFFACLD